MDEREIRLRLIEAAAAHPIPHPEGYAAGVLATARAWEIYVLKSGTLGLPKK
jgi:hypothetical protein